MRPIYWQCTWKHSSRGGHICHLSLLVCFRMLVTLVFCPYLVICPICSHSPPYHLLTLWPICIFDRCINIRYLPPSPIIPIWWQATNYDSIIFYTWCIGITGSTTLVKSPHAWRSNGLLKLFSYPSIQGVTGYTWFSSAVSTLYSIFISTTK